MKTVIEVWRVEGAQLIYAYYHNGEKLVKSEFEKKLSFDLIKKLENINVGEKIVTDKFIFIGEDFDVS